LFPKEMSATFVRK